MSLEQDKQFLEIKRLNKEGSGEIKKRRKSINEDHIIMINEAEDNQGPSVPTETPLTNYSLPTGIKLLQRKLKTRYHRKDNDFISYFDDVEFDQRPSILDGSISEPFQLKFNGPTLEKEIKNKEKLRRKRLRTHVKESTSSTSSLITPDLTKSETLEINDFANFHTSFAGIYVALWMSIAIGIVKILFNFYWTHNNSVMDLPIVNFMTTDLFIVALLDLFFYMATFTSFIIQWLCKKKFISWHPVGRTFMIVFESLFFLAGILIPEHVLGLHWIAKIFLFLHSLVLLMKTHSYTFYHGYLWDLWKELHYSKEKLKQLSDNDSKVDPSTIDILQKSVDFCEFEFNLQAQQCSSINGDSTGMIQFPDTITFKNYFMFTMFPVLVYQNKYPRTSHIRWNYVVEKLFAIFGTIFIMIVTAQVFMYPIAIHAITIRESPWTSWPDRLTKWSKIMVDIAPSFICMYLLTFYLIWDAILNCIAELTMFGDRYFYGDWWNCVNWGEFSRIWNIPVHKFLLRHVYHSSISAFQLSKGQATFMTFLLSAIFHELSMYVIFNRLRFYLFFFQMLQLPLVSLSNSKLLRDKPIIGNVIFWIGICIGPSIMCSLYLTI